MIPRGTLMSFAALALAGSMGGVYLGRSAVAEINPVHFQEPETRFHADLVPYRPTEAAGYRAGDLSQANLDQALGRGCVNCLTYPEEVILVHRGQDSKYVPGRAELAPEPVATVAVEQAPVPEFAAVERYTSYRIVEAETPDEPSAQMEFAVTDAASTTATD